MYGDLQFDEMEDDLVMKDSDNADYFDESADEVVED
jgi:hypothetical protein